jgi:hypothetical protein
MSERDEPVEVEVDRVEVETDKAIMFSKDGEEFWIPKSKISEDSEVEGLGDSGTLVIPWWLAEEKGLV